MRIWHVALAVGLTTALVAQAPPATKWNVADPVGPTVNVAFDTTEGTWMNVDVSPDGRRLVFDLLGDIYTMPIEGGTATRVARRRGVRDAAALQPGRRAHRVHERSRRALEHLDDEDRRHGSRSRSRAKRQWFVNSPTWGPDGQAIYARRHFVTTRSLGAGEVWMYHAAGSDGLQVTRARERSRRTSASRRFRRTASTSTYSKDVTPGTLFEYNKDPNGVIFAVLRRDLATGRETSVRRTGRADR